MQYMPTVTRMREMTKRWIQLGGAVTLVQSALWAQFPLTPVSIYDLKEQADVIALGTVQAASVQGNIIKTQLQVSQTIKGQLPSLTLVVDVIPSRYMAENGVVPAAVRGGTGLWFLKANSGGWQVLPRAKGDYATWDQYSLPLPNVVSISAGSILPGLAGAEASTDQVILAAIVSWYESLSNPERIDDLDVVDLSRWNRADALAVVDALRTSPKRDIQVVGLAAAIRLGDDEAFTALAQEAASLQASPKFFEVTYALNDYYRPNGDSSIIPLQALVAARLAVPGLDLAAGTALQRIKSKAVLPAMALLLDSSDSQAQLRAVSVFVQFAVFARADGSIPVEYGPVGPFWTPDTQAHQAGRNARFTTAEIVSFWKSWWLAHKAQLGFE